MRKTLVISIAIVLLIVVAGGYLAYTFLSNQNNNQPEPAVLSVEQIRDQALSYIAANHTQTMPMMSSLHWSGGRQDKGLLGAETYQYTGGDWVCIVQYPVVPNTIYTITTEYTLLEGHAPILMWEGMLQNGTITPTSYRYNP